jgi:hypothetical protein
VAGRLTPVETRLTPTPARLTFAGTSCKPIPVRPIIEAISVPRRTPKVSFDAIRSGVDQKINAVEVAELAEIAKIVGGW